MKCKKCNKDISSYKIYEDYRIENNRVCEGCWLVYMSSKNINEMEVPDFTKAITI